MAKSKKKNPHQKVTGSLIIASCNCIINFRFKGYISAMKPEGLGSTPAIMNTYAYILGSVPKKNAHFKKSF